MINIGVLGATSPAGEQVLRILSGRDVNVLAFSRKPQMSSDSVQWVDISAPNAIGNLAGRKITHWIVLSHIWVLRDYYHLLLSLKAERLICISSTSRFTKTESASDYEHDLVNRLADGEASVQKWAEENRISWTILRPTMIYGRGNDRNLSEIVRFIRKFHVFPLFGEAKGMRQPIYVDDVSKAAVQSLFSDSAICKAYNISGKEALTYQDMIRRIFQALGKKELVLPIPLWVFRLFLKVLRIIPRYRGWNDQMVVRMNQDMVFDHAEATRDFDFSPQGFSLHEIDLQGNVVNGGKQ